MVIFGNQDIAPATMDQLESNIKKSGVQCNVHTDGYVIDQSELKEGRSGDQVAIPTSGTSENIVNIYVTDGSGDSGSSRSNKRGDVNDHKTIKVDEDHKESLFTNTVDKITNNKNNENSENSGKANEGSNFLKWFIIIVILVAVGILGYMLYTWFTNRNSGSGNAKSPSIPSTNSSSVTNLTGAPPTTPSSGSPSSGDPSSGAPPTTPSSGAPTSVNTNQALLNAAVNMYENTAKKIQKTVK
jgi:hypothetical protein